MALSTATLSTKIQTEIIAIWGVAEDSDKLKEFCDAIAAAIVTEIQTNAVVPAGIPVQVSTLNGTGTTTGPGTVT